MNLLLRDLFLDYTLRNIALGAAVLGLVSGVLGSFAVLRRQGLMDNILCLDPHETLGPGQAEEIDRVSAAYPELTDDAFVAQNLQRWLA